MNSEQFAVLAFRFLGVLMIIGLIPTAITSSIPVLYWSARFSIAAATDNDVLAFVDAVWPIVALVVAALLIIFSKRLGALIAKGL